MKSEKHVPFKIGALFLFGFLTMLTSYASGRVESKFPIVLEAEKDSEPVVSENPKFVKKFNSLVSRAYFKLLVEAERADIRLGTEYQRLYAKNEDKMDDVHIQKEFTLVYNRFLAHRRMLSGLKSWRIFSEDRTGDLEYFKKEYHEVIYEMYQNKSSEDEMVAYLMYRLADLYHLPQ